MFFLFCSYAVNIEDTYFPTLLDPNLNNTWSKLRYQHLTWSEPNQNIINTWSKLRYQHLTWSKFKNSNIKTFLQLYPFRESNPEMNPSWNPVSGAWNPQCSPCTQIQGSEYSLSPNSSLQPAASTLQFVIQWARFE